MMEKTKLLTSLTVAVVMLLCLSTALARKNRGKNRKQSPKSPEWKTSSDPGRDERFVLEDEGQTVRLDCRAKGKPSPKVTWYKNGHVITNGDERVEIKKYKLTIKSLGAEDKGNYTCIVSNTEGQIDWTFYVEVEVRIWPLEVEGPRNMTVLEGATVRFQCRVLNDADATIRWLKPSTDSSNSALSSGYRGKPQFLDNTNTETPEILQLDEVTADDAGEYRCLAGNVWGLKYSSAYLKVITPTTTSTTTTTTTTSTTTTPTTTSTTPTTTTPSTTSTTFSPFFRPGRTLYPPYTFGPDLYATTRPPRHHRKDRKDKKDKGNRKKGKNGRRRKNKKKDRMTAAPVPTTTPFPVTPFFLSSTTGSSFTTIWNMDDGMLDKYPDYSDFPSTEGEMEADSAGSRGDEEGWISLWTIYTIVGAIAGVILLIGLLAIFIAVCCRRTEGSGYKSTPV